MKLEDQVCSLELAKKLRSLGEPQESLWYWWYDICCGEWKIGDNWFKYPDQKKKAISAYTVAELGERLEDEVFTARSGKEWLVGWLPNFEYIQTKMDSDTEANARAKMKIYLLEKK